MDNKIAKALIDKYLQGNCTPEEKATVETWYNRLAAGQKDILGLPDYNELHERIQAGLPAEPEKAKVTRLWPRIAAAASVLLVLSTGVYFALHKKQPVQQIAQNQTHDLLPGSNKAILTLSSGKQLSLTDASNGTIAKEHNTTIEKNKNGTVSYNGDNAQSGGQLVYNTITTPRGGQWYLVLPDGTRAMLDAASSIKYPIAFNGNERRVQITGQVYFEVVHNAAKPFLVDVKEQTIEDRGTHFNINAYDDEPAIRTTLLEGSVKITRGTETALLKPGQQASTVDGSNTIKVGDADLDETVAWKNGLFSFKNADMQTVMRQLSRWYDVDITYEGNIPHRFFNGDMHRNLKASQVLDVLSFYKVHFEIAGKRIIVKE
jgi:transmembrane sensor